MKFIDMFCGMGTARMGFEQAGHECVYSIEWDKHKRRIYDVIFGKEPEGRDIRDTRAAELPKSDCWVAGFPCQDISVAGKQVGFDGNRSSLYFQVMRLLHETPEEDRPKYLLFENVKNFFSVNGGRDFLSALVAMDEVGYDAEWDLLNSKNFGVPQNRERVFIVGHLRGRSTRKVFPITGPNSHLNTELRVIGNLGFISNEMRSRVYGTDGLCPILGTMQGGYTQPMVIDHNKVRLTDDTSMCIMASYHKGLDNHGARTGILEARAVLTPDRLEKRQNGRRFKEDGEPMFTLTGQDRHGVMITEGHDYVNKKYQEFIDKNGYIPEMFNPYNCSEITDTAPTLTAQGASVTKSSTVLKSEGSRIRRLTPRECMRLQGVPDEITDKLIAAGISDTQLYRAAGDAWSVPVGYEIARRL